jgi:hypothetical protein
MGYTIRKTNRRNEQQTEDDLLIATCPHYIDIKIGSTDCTSCPHFVEVFFLVGHGNQIRCTGFHDLPSGFRARHYKKPLETVVKNITEDVADSICGVLDQLTDIKKKYQLTETDMEQYTIKFSSLLQKELNTLQEQFEEVEE